jgi:hypothetical protein
MHYLWPVALAEKVGKPSLDAVRVLVDEDTNNVIASLVGIVQGLASENPNTRAGYLPTCATVPLPRNKSRNRASTRDAKASASSATPILTEFIRQELSVVDGLSV